VRSPSGLAHSRIDATYVVRQDLVGPVLEDEDGLATSRLGPVGDVAVLRLFEVAIAGERIRDARIRWRRAKSVLGGLGKGLREEWIVRSGERGGKRRERDSRSPC
jgi:hypothetical protein